MVNTQHLSNGGGNCWSCLQGWSQQQAPLLRFPLTLTVQTGAGSRCSDPPARAATATPGPQPIPTPAVPPRVATPPIPALAIPPRSPSVACTRKPLDCVHSSSSHLAKAAWTQSALGYSWPAPTTAPPVPMVALVQSMPGHTHSRSSRPNWEAQVPNTPEPPSQRPPRSSSPIRGAPGWSAQTPGMYLCHLHLASQSHQAHTSCKRDVPTQGHSFETRRVGDFTEIT